MTYIVISQDMDQDVFWCKKKWSSCLWFMPTEEYWEKLSHARFEACFCSFTLKTWRHYLHGKKFKVYSDHKSIGYIFTQKELNLRQRRWLEHLNYDFDLRYYPGKENVVTNALSWKNRQPCPIGPLGSGRCLKTYPTFVLSGVRRLTGAKRSIGCEVW